MAYQVSLKLQNMLSYHCSQKLKLLGNGINYAFQAVRNI